MTLLLVLLCMGSTDAFVPMVSGYESGQLHSDLFPAKHNPSDRPTRNASNPIHVSIKMNLYQILAVDEANQVVKLYVWMTQSWEDEFLVWNATLRNAAPSHLVVPYTSTWAPDTCLYNNLELETVVTERMTNVILEPSERGSLVTLRYPAIYHVACRMNIRFFPFDVQNCTLVFGSWAYDATGIDYHPEGLEVALESYVRSQEWELLSFSIHKLYVNYSCCYNPFPHVNMYLVIYRFRSSMFQHNGSAQVLLLMMSEVMPKTSNYVPVINIYFLMLIILNSAATIASSLIIALQRRSEYNKHIPTKLKVVLFKYIGPLLRIKPPRSLSIQRFCKAVKDQHTVISTIHRFKRIAKENKASKEPKEPIMSSKSSSSSEKEESREEELNNLTLRELLLQNFRLLRAELKRMEDVVRVRQATDLNSLEHEYLASILDRGCLFLFLTANLVITGSFLLLAYWDSSGTPTPAF